MFRRLLHPLFCYSRQLPTGWSKNLGNVVMHRQMRCPDCGRTYWTE